MGHGPQHPAEAAGRYAAKQSTTEEDDGAPCWPAAMDAACEQAAKSNSAIDRKITPRMRRQDFYPERRCIPCTGTRMLHPAALEPDHDEAG